VAAGDIRPAAFPGAAAARHRSSSAAVLGPAVLTADVSSLLTVLSDVDINRGNLRFRDMRMKNNVFMLSFGKSFQFVEFLIGMLALTDDR